jgi:plasmid stabilization system protein ParE
MKLPDFSPQSLVDLKGILLFIAKDRPQAARRFVQRLKEKCVETGVQLGSLSVQI